MEKLPKSRTEHVLASLRSDILSGVLAPGTAIIQEEVASRLGVSITPVREALRRLQSAGLITYEAYYGATVTSISDEALEELYLLRGVIEGLAARLAVTKIDENGLHQLESIHQSMLDAKLRSDVAAMAAGSREFHSVIGKTGGPEYIAHHIKIIWEYSSIPTTHSAWNDADIAQHCLDAHQALINALRARDSLEAERLMNKHVVGVFTELRSLRSR